jgi:uncharacterized protein (DUF2252 family)
MPRLIPIRFGRMAESPFAFYRGSAALMAADLATTPVTGIRVQACGDAHLMNFGGFATPERNVVFDVNDLDETLPAPWEWDLKRLAASAVIAAQHLRFPGSDAARVAAVVAREYRERMADYAHMRALDVRSTCKTSPIGPQIRRFSKKPGGAFGRGSRRAARSRRRSICSRS